MHLAGDRVRQSAHLVAHPALIVAADRLGHHDELAAELLDLRDERSRPHAADDRRLSARLDALHVTVGVGVQRRRLVVQDRPALDVPADGEDVIEEEVREGQVVHDARDARRVLEQEIDRVGGRADGRRRKRELDRVCVSRHDDRPQ
jgi:hypothetical protein